MATEVLFNAKILGEMLIEAVDLADAESQFYESFHSTHWAVPAMPEREIEFARMHCGTEVMADGAWQDIHHIIQAGIEEDIRLNKYVRITGDVDGVAAAA